MAGILNFCRMLLKPRRHQRYTVKSGTVVILSPGTYKEQKVQLIDISRGGAAFIYQGSPEELEASGVLKMLAEKPLLEKVNFETVSDSPTHKNVQTLDTYRRRGVKFKWLGVMEESQLKDFIKEVGITKK
jgi:hypothetical protein